MNCPVYLTFVILLANETNSQNGDYCVVDCKEDKHTACINGHNQCDLTCPNLNDGLDLLNDEQRLEILNTHNLLREKVASGKEEQGGLADVKVSNMEIISWSYEAEFIASCLAKRCVMEHDKCRNLLNGTYVGQNLAYKSDSENTIKEKWRRPDGFNADIDIWYSEVKDCDAALYDSYTESGKMVGHFTQLIWAESNRIGCAFMFYNEGDMHSALLVCNYWPGGNLLSQPVFNKGDLGPDCGKDTRYPHLCGVQIPLKGNIAFCPLQSFAIMILMYTFKFLSL